MPEQTPQRLRLMVVEDEAIVAADLEQRLERLGYQVIGVADEASDAMAIARAERPDLALLDIHIRGGEDGIAVGTRLRDELGVPVVYVTAHADPATLARAGLSEPFGYVVKPFDDREIHSAIETARYRFAAEDRLRKMERWLTTTLSSIGDGVLATDRAGRLVYLNQVAERLTGWSRGEAIGQRLETVFVAYAEGGTDPLEDLFERVFETGVVFHLTGEAQLRRRDGSLLAIDDSVAAIRRDDGSMDGVVVVFRDRTRDHDIVQRQRQLEQKMLESQKLESLGLLAGGVAHDFNNLLAIIRSNSDLLQEAAAPGSALEGGLRQIEQAASRGADLCAQMLAYAGKGKAVQREIDLSQFVQEGVGLLEVSLGHRTRLELDLAGDLPRVEVDPSQIQQVLMNLVINAADAMVGDSGTIAVRTRLAELEATGTQPSQDEPLALPAGRYAMLEVEDDGCGMTQEVVDRIFDPFFTTKQTGRGLGLAAVQGILRQHGGGLTVATSPGEGTRFTVYLPAPERPQRAELPPPVTFDASWQGAGRVLFADDEVGIRRVARIVLERLGLEVEDVVDGAVAIEALRRAPQSFALAMLDVTMPNVNGVRAALEIHRLAPDLPIVLLSGFDFEPPTESALGSVVTSYLRKPFTLDQLRATVRAAVENAPSHG